MPSRSATPKELALELTNRIIVIALTALFIAAMFLLFTNFFPLSGVAIGVLAFGTILQLCVKEGPSCSGSDLWFVRLSTTMASWFSLMCLAAPDMTAISWLIRAIAIAAYTLVLVIIKAFLATRRQRQ